MSKTGSATTAMRVALSVASMTFAFASAAQASAIRTFVSGLGSDSNTATNCSRPNPCRNFAAAYSVTLAGGDIIALDPAGYGNLTITTPVTIEGAQLALVAVPTGTTGITVSAGASDKIILSNLHITGAGATNTTGIKVTSGRVVIQRSTVELLTTGLDIRNVKADAVDTDIIANGTGIATTGLGTDFNCNPQTFGPTNVRLSGGNVINNTTAYLMHDPGLGSLNNCNRITIFARNPNGVYSVNQTGNNTLVTGDGTSCTFNVNFCTSIGSYQPGVNSQLN